MKIGIIDNKVRYASYLKTSWNILIDRFILIFIFSNYMRLNIVILFDGFQCYFYFEDV